MKPIEDIQIEELRAGKPKAQRLLYENCYRKMYALCLRYCNNRTDAEDIMIQGFTKIFNKINDYNGTNFEGWMKRIFVNEAINHFHKNKNQTWFHTEEPNEYLTANTVDALGELSLQDLNAMLGQLPEGCKIIFNLYAIEGYQHQEIAAILGVSESTSKSQFARAKVLLQRKLNQIEPWKKEAI